MTRLRWLSQNPGLLAACHAVFMHWHVEWETSLRTTIHSSAKYTQLETVWLTDIKAVMFRQMVWRRPVLCRLLCFQWRQKESEMAGRGRMKPDVMRVERAARKNQCSNKQWQKGVSVRFLCWGGVGVWLLISGRLCVCVYERGIVIAVNEKSSTRMEDKPRCSLSTQVVSTSPDIQFQQRVCDQHWDFD